MSQALRDGERVVTERRTLRATAFWHVALAFFVTMLGATLPTPLYPLYQRQFGLSTVTTTVIFAAYSAGVLTALVVAGRGSDSFGRRWPLLAGLASSMMSSVVFLGARDVDALCAGRMLSGLAAGTFTGTATATLVDFAAEELGERATLVATLANMGGLGAGPLVAGLLAKTAAAPLQLPYVVHLALLAVVTVGVWRMPEPVALDGRPRFRVTLPRVPGPMRGTFVRAAIAGFAGFAVLGLFTAVVPAILSRLLARTDPVFTGAAVCALFLASTVGQVALVRPLGQAALVVGCAGLAVGMAVLAVGLWVESLVLLALATMVAGLGQGVALRAGLGAINAEAPQTQRAEAASTFFLVVYVAISLPVIGVGLAADTWGLQTASIGFSLAVAGLATVALVSLLQTPRNVQVAAPRAATEDV